MTPKSRIFLWRVNYRAKTDKIDMFMSDAKRILEMNSNTLMLLAGVIPFHPKSIWRCEGNVFCILQGRIYSILLCLLDFSVIFPSSSWNVTM